MEENMKKISLFLTLLIVLCSCEQMISGNKVEAVKTVYTITHGEYEGGSIVKSPVKDEYQRNESVTVRAVPEEGWEFVKWTGDVESRETTITLKMEKNYVITPEFLKIQTFSISVPDLEGGSIKIEPNKEKFTMSEKVRITAVAQDGWYFQGWNNTGFGFDECIEIVMDKDYVLSPIFAAEPKYSLVIHESEGGSIQYFPVKETYDCNETVTLTIEIHEGYRFKGITGTILTGDLTKQIVMDKNYELTPLFTKNQKYSITLDSSYTESIHMDPKKEGYDENERVVITALPIEGFTFVRWEGTVLSNNAIIDVIMNRDYVQRPVYKKNDTYSISIQNSGGGQVYISPQKESYEKDEQVTITAVPEDDYFFKGWLGSVISPDQNISIVMNKNYTLESVFSPVVKYDLVIKDTAGGRVVCAPEKDSYTENEEVSLTAIPVDGYVFSYWKGDITGTKNPYVLKMLRNYEAEPVFEPIPEIEKFTIGNPQITGNGSVVIEPEKEYYLKNETVTIRAVPDSGSMISSMICSSQDYSWNNKTKEMTIQVRSNITFEAEFINRDWTFVVYMAADNDLEYEAVIDFNELEGVDYTGKPVSIIVLLDRNPAYDSSNGNWSGTRLYEIQSDNSGVDGIIKSKELSCPELDLGSGCTTNLNTASTDVLEKVIDFVQAEYSAENYGLIVWGHGTGWRGGIGEAASSKAFAVDDTAGTYMTNAAFGQSLEEKDFTIIGFDTCYGGIIETAYEIKDSAQCMIASESSIPARGWDYYSLFTTFLNTDLSASSFCDQTVTQFKNQYSGEEKCTISVIDLLKIQEVKNRFDVFTHEAASLVTSIENRESIRNIILNQTLVFSHTSYPCNLYVDMYSLSNNLSTAFSSLLPQAQLLQTALKDAVTDSWSSFSTEGYNLGVYFCDLYSQGVPLSTHAASYIQGSGAAQQSKFVQESTGWVPTKNTNGSLLDKLFYATDL